jgi:hypothetical protein
MSLPQTVSLAHLDGLLQATDELISLVAPIMTKTAPIIDHGTFNAYITIVGRCHAHGIPLKVRTDMLKDNLKLAVEATAESVKEN